MEITEKNIEYLDNYEDWLQIYACKKGQRYIKKQGSKYLPYPISMDNDARASTEFQEDYSIYLGNAVFVDYTAESIEDLVASAFRRDPEIEPPPPQKLEYYDYTSTAKELTDNVVSYGRVFIIADYPVESSTDAVAYTEIYPPDKVINWETNRYAGSDRLTRAVLIDGYTDDSSPKTIYRELILEENIYKVRIYHDEEFQEEYIPLAQGSNLDAIPGTFVGALSNTSRVDKSPVLGISNLNIAHYKTFAELMYTQTYVGHPQLVATGLAPGFIKQANKNGMQLSVGASKVLTLEGETSDIKLLEINPNTIHFQTLDKLQTSMQDLGTKMKSQTSASGVESSATLKTKNSENTSKLSAIVNNVENAVELIYSYLGLFMGITYEPIITINREFLDPTVDADLLSKISASEVVGTLPVGSTYTYLVSSELVTDPEQQATISKLCSRGCDLPQTPTPKDPNGKT